MRPAGEDKITLASPQALHRQVHRHERRRARGVNDETRATEIKLIGQPVGDYAVGRPGAGVEVDRIDIGALKPVVLAAVVDDADKDSRLAAGQSFYRLSRILEC